MSKEFAGKVAFVTGGATGIGAACAQSLHDAGAAVVVADVDMDTATRTAEAMASAEAPAIALECDVADERSVQRAVDETVGELGGVDILINNAARHSKKYARTFASLTHDEIRGMFDVNVMGIINCSLACRPSMEARGNGVIVNIGSSAAYTVGTPYGVSKLAARGLTIALAKELAPFGIRVNSVAPTLTPTQAMLDDFSADDFEAAIRTRQLIQRQSTVDDITRVVRFLCSEDSSFVTGETIRATGGVALSI